MPELEFRVIVVLLFPLWTLLSLFSTQTSNSKTVQRGLGREIVVVVPRSKKRELHEDYRVSGGREKEEVEGTAFVVVCLN